MLRADKRWARDVLEYCRWINTCARRRFFIGVSAGIAGAFGSILATVPAQAQTEIPSACDRLAASGYDENAVSDPVTWIVLSRNAALAIKVCRKAVEANADTLRFKYQLARALDAAEKYDEAAPIYQELADIPYPAALAELGVLYSTGMGVPKDKEKAFSLAERSAELGNLRGLTIAGVFLVYGTGTEKNVEKGVELLNRAADKDFGEAMEYLADIQLQGVNGKADPAKALELYERAASKGRIRAAMGAAQLLYGNAETHDRAYYWFSTAASAGDTTAMRLLAKMIGSGEATEQSGDRAVAWLVKAAEAGDAAAYFDLGRLYEKGQAVERNTERAKHWFQEGVKANDPASAYRLARGYDKGEYGDNPELVIDYLVFAALSGLKPAIDALLNGLPVPTWTESSRRGLQAKLKAEGHYSGPIDGIPGPETLEAVRKLLQP